MFWQYFIRNLIPAVFLIIFFGLRISANAIDSDSAIVLAQRYLNPDIEFDVSLKSRIQIDSIKISHQTSPYFRHFLDGRTAWEIVVPQLNQLYTDSMLSKLRGEFDYHILVDHETGLLLKIAYRPDSIVLTDDEQKRIETSLLAKGMGYSGISADKPFPFLKLLTNTMYNVFEAKAFEAFFVYSKSKEDMQKSFWHIVLYDYPASTAVPPPVKPNSNEYEYKAITVRVRSDIVLDGTTGKLLTISGMN